MSTGRLAVWNDCRETDGAAYEAWYQGEHLAERVAIPGFYRGRRYEARTGSPAYFTYYEVESPDVLTSAAYLERVNTPTPLTTEIMSGSFLNMSRTICRVVARAGVMRGAWAVTRETAEGDAAVLNHLVASIPSPALARAEVWEGVPEDTAQNAEQHLRGPDATVPGCLFVETLREADAVRVASALGHDARVWRLLVDLEQTLSLPSSAGGSAAHPTR